MHFIFTVCIYLKCTWCHCKGDVFFIHIIAQWHVKIVQVDSSAIEVGYFKSKLEQIWLDLVKYLNIMKIKLVIIYDIQIFDNSNNNNNNNTIAVGSSTAVAIIWTGSSLDGESVESIEVQFLVIKCHSTMYATLLKFLGALHTFVCIPLIHLLNTQVIFSLFSIYLTNKL